MEITITQILKIATATKDIEKSVLVSHRTRIVLNGATMPTESLNKHQMEICNLCKKDPCICPLELL